MPPELAGRLLDGEAAQLIKSAGIDICGENGEYHTLAVDGPIFKRRLLFKVRGTIELGDYMVADIVCAEM